MADPFSIVSGAAGIIAVGIEVIQSLVKFYDKYKHRDTEIVRTLVNLQSLYDILQSLNVAIRKPQTRPEGQELSQDIVKAIEKAKRLSKVSNRGFGDRIRIASRRAAYPFRTSTLQKFQEDVGEIRENLNLALSVLQHKSSITVHEETSELRLFVERINVNQTASTIRDWLKAPDATTNHNSARLKCHTKTGLWLIKGHIFTAWLNEPNSFIWINGFPGSGKSILCSTAIQHTLREKQYEQRVGIAFFYFDFRDQNKQDSMGMLRALLLQLSGQLEECAQDLRQLYRAYDSGTPPTEALIIYLQRMIKRFYHVYIVLDALDESPRYNQRDGVLEAIETIRMWRLPGLHFLVTSRNEIDIRRSLKPARDQVIPMKNTEIDKDIASFVRYQLINNSAFSRWKDDSCEIVPILTKQAQGVFHYVRLQLDALKRALNRNHLHRCLHSLPRDLDEIYERIIDSIDKDYIDDVRRILTMLCFSNDPMTVGELIHAHAVDLNGPPYLDSGRVLDIDGLQEICTGLIEIVGVQDYKDTEAQVVQIAHFSVQEYLQSERIKQQKAAIFALNASDAEVEITQVCLAYLLNPALSSIDLKSIEQSQFSMAQYAAVNWYHHYKSFHDQENETEKMVLQLFHDRTGLFDTWVSLHDSNFSLAEKDGPLFSPEEKTMTPLYCASYLGLARITQKLLRDGLDINAAGGRYHSPLNAASYRGHETVVHILLEAGANANNRGKICQNALQLELKAGHETDVATLLEYVAGLTKMDHETAIQLAAAEGHQAVVKVLLAHGADINARYKYSGTALKCASESGHEAIVQMLLAHGDETNIHHEMFETALQAAAAKGHETILKSLLARGANVNGHSPGRPTALQAASAGGHEAVVRILLGHGADIDTHSEKYGTALQAASANGYDVIVQVLLAHGADANTPHEFHGRAPNKALSTVHFMAMLQMHLSNAPRAVIKRNKSLWNISEEGCTAMAESMRARYVDRGSRKYATALQAASFRGHEKIVQMLVDHGADVNAHHEDFGTALQSAATEGHESIVDILLAHGAIDDRHPKPAQEQREKEGYQED